MTSGILTLGDGCRLAWRLDGLADAPVVLLSNSLGTSMAMWDPQMEVLARRFRVLRYDSRGHGASGVPAGSYSLDRLGRDVIELLDAFELAQVDFCGLSLGGMIGQWLGYRAPDRLRRVVLANTAAYMGPPQQWDGRIATVQQTGMAAIAEASVTRWFTARFAQQHQEAVAPIRAGLLATDPLGYAGCCAAIRDMDLRGVAALNPKPSLVLAGSLDPATPPADAEALARSLPDAHLVFLQAAHLSNVEQPKAFAREVLAFLD
jgi:3-oxoadipate enol-lactonase